MLGTWYCVGGVLGTWYCSGGVLENVILWRPCAGNDLVHAVWNSRPISIRYSEYLPHIRYLHGRKHREPLYYLYTQLNRYWRGCLCSCISLYRCWVFVIFAKIDDDSSKYAEHKSLLSCRWCGDIVCHWQSGLCTVRILSPTF